MTASNDRGPPLEISVEIRVFYAWQDDRPGKVCRYLIRDAAKDACDELIADGSNKFRVNLDEGTLGVPGMCDIPNTILDKIAACDVFLCDVTLVWSYEGKASRQKMTSNPNVLFELGFAAHAIGFDRVIGVMNTAYGVPEDQMFDTKRRWAVRFNLSESSSPPEIKNAQRSLTADIKEALETILSKSVSPATRQGRLRALRRKATVL